MTPLARSRSGSTSTWNCLSRWPQMATLATPGTDISFGRIVHRARIVRSCCDSVFDQTPIFITRLVEESGCRMTGGLATVGSCRASAATRSCTSCRTCRWSAPCSKDQHDLRQAEHRLRAHRVDVRNAGEGVLERHRDQALDLLAGQAGRLGLDLDERRGELGKDVERRVPDRPIARRPAARRTAPAARRAGERRWRRARRAWALYVIC